MPKRRFRHEAGIARSSHHIGERERVPTKAFCHETGLTHNVHHIGKREREIRIRIAREGNEYQGLWIDSKFRPHHQDLSGSSATVTPDLLVLTVDHWQ